MPVRPTNPSHFPARSAGLALVGAALFVIALVAVVALVSTVASGAESYPAPGLGALRHFPHDVGMVDVKEDYGAAGDGVTDDTAALRRAIGENVGRTNSPRTLYFPEGRYLVSDTLEWRMTEPETRSNGGYRAFLVMQGQGRGRSVIVLKDACPGF